MTCYKEESLMVEIKNDVVTISFPKELLSSDTVLRFLDLLDLERTAKKSKLSRKVAWELSEEIKENWWKANKHKLMKEKIGK
jgi:hypothetical protein